MRKILLIGFIVLLVLPIVNAFDPYPLKHVNICYSGIKYYYCEEPRQRTYRSNYGQPYFLNRQWNENIQYKDITPKLQEPLRSRIYSYPSQPYRPGTFTKWRYTR